MTTKIYLNTLDNTQYNVFDEIQQNLLEDENGNFYFDTEEDAAWWQDLFNAMEKIDDFKSELSRREALEFDHAMDDCIYELCDYIEIANQLYDETV